MNIHDAFPSNYLKASDLGDAQPNVLIDRVELEPVGRDKEMKPIVYFKGKQKGLVLNKTNSKKIAELAGSPDTEEWAGVSVKLYATETEFAGETVECIRIKSAKPKATGTRPAARRAAPPPPPVEQGDPDEDGPENIDESEIPF